MGYNVIDVVNRAIDVAVRIEEVHKKISDKESNGSPIKVLSKVLIKQVDKRIEHYKTIIRRTENTEFEDIDFEIYDKISFLVNEFIKKIYLPEINNVREYLKFSLGLEKDMCSLLIDIKGRYVKNMSDTETKTYKILDDMIKNESGQVKVIEDTLK